MRFPERVFAGPVLARQGFVDDDYRRCACFVLFREGAAFDDANTHRVEIVRRANAVAAVVLLTGNGLRHAFDEVRVGRVCSAKRQVVDRRGRLDAGLRLHALDQFVLKRHPLRLFPVLRAGQYQIHREHVVRVETGIRFQQRQETACQQAGADEQHE